MYEVEKDIESIIENVGKPIYKLEGSKILISGASGFLGSWYIAIFETLNKKYFKKPCKIIAVDSGITSDNKNSLVKINSQHIKWITSDIATYKIEQKVDYIIHAAGIASPIYYRKYPIETIEGMVLGLSHLLKFAVKNKVKSFFVFSSSEIYGNPHTDKVPTEETYKGNVSCTGPRSCYDESKRMEETMCAAYYRVHNIPLKWVRPFNVYGPGMRVNDDRVIPKFMAQILNNKPITVHIPGIQTRTFCYITDAMTGFLKTMLIGKNGEVYNIGYNKEEISMSDLAHKMISIFPTKSKIKTISMLKEYPKDQAQRRCPNINKARQELNFKPNVNLKSGLLKMWEWAKIKYTD